jgi:hypothetical protein
MELQDVGGADLSGDYVSEGGFGVVYGAELNDGRKVVVKRFKRSLDVHTDLEFFKFLVPDAFPTQGGVFVDVQTAFDGDEFKDFRDAFVYPLAYYIGKNDFDAEHPKNIDDISYIIFDRFTTDGKTYMENNPQNNPQTLPLPSKVLRFGEKVCGGLRFLHSKGLFWGDLKPENVLVEECNRSFVCAKIKGIDVSVITNLDKLDERGIPINLNIPIHTPLFMPQWFPFWTNMIRYILGEEISLSKNNMKVFTDKFTKAMASADMHSFISCLVKTWTHNDECGALSSNEYAYIHSTSVVARAVAGILFGPQIESCVGEDGSDPVTSFTSYYFNEVRGLDESEKIHLDALKNMFMLGLSSRSAADMYEADGQPKWQQPINIHDIKAPVPIMPPNFVPAGVSV